MMSFPEFETAFLAALQQERSDLQGLQGASEAQLSAWIQHLFQRFLGYTHWKEIDREIGAPIGAKGSKQMFPDLRVNVLDNGLIFIECKRLGRLEGAKGQDELNDGMAQLKSYIRSHLDKASIKPETVLGVVTDGNRWHLLGLNKSNDFHTIAEWAFLTDDPRLLAQRLWLLAKAALAQPTSALVEFLARRTLFEVLKENAKWLTKKVNEKLPEGTVSEELVNKWLRDGFSDSVPGRIPQAEPSAASSVQLQPAQPQAIAADKPQSKADEEAPEVASRRIQVSDLLQAGLLLTQDVLVVEGVEGRRQTASLTADGRINVAGQFFDSVSPAALRALELAGKTRKAVNGWTAFQVMRAGVEIGSLLEIRAQYEDKEEEGEAAASPAAPASAVGESQDEALHAAVDQMKPLLGLLPELSVNISKSSVSFYAGKFVVGYAYPRKRGLPRIRIYVADKCPDWATPDSTYAAWCYVDDWNSDISKVVDLFKRAPQLRAEEMTAGLDAYRRRTT